jgi:hypothetical protein
MIGMNAFNGQALGALAHIRQSLTDILTTPILRGIGAALTWLGSTRYWLAEHYF